jgi:hypothetical protein
MERVQAPANPPARDDSDLNQRCARIVQHMLEKSVRSQRMMSRSKACACAHTRKKLTKSKLHIDWGLLSCFALRGVNFLALDFDLTIIDVHTGGRWPGTPADLRRRIRPLFNLLIPAAISNGLCYEHSLVVCLNAYIL